jgi:hypothetical protein
MKLCLITALAAALLASATAEAAPAYACGGFALAGGAQLLCSHIDPKAPTQTCSFFWSLMTTDNRTDVVQGTFLLVPGTANAVVYQGFGFNEALANPIVLCQGR